MDNLVSVIIPTYKRPFGTLVKAINSVLEQSYSNLEVIIVDDSPNGDSNRNEVENKIKTLVDPRVRYIQHEFNQGACSARNSGIEVCRGKYIAFLDDDDEWLSKKLELQLAKFENTEVGLVYCDSYTITLKDDKEIKKDMRANRVSGWVYDKLILDNFIGSTSFIMLRKEALDTCGFFNNNLKSAQDYELWLRISKKYKVDYVDTPLVNYYVHEGERISTNIDYRIQGLEKINELNMNYLGLHPKVNCLRNLKLVPYYNKKYGHKVAFLKWLEAVKLYPFQTENIKCFINIINYTFQKNVCHIDRRN
ncbi:glycosyltransferase [Peribacillus simplex]|uniref:glycosyltransferase family 2 protein n=1 Tax=Peribacillus simplex TaxID=1478 RepID=UPI00192438A3|nr:glycosyltransferase [Peribacillus simplex]MBD8591096.1 glycosyltransferase [Peribacillus simplex]